MKIRAWCLSLCAAGVLAASSASAASQEVKHFVVDILAIEGEEYVVKSENGGEGRIHVGTDTEKFGQVQPGDRIEVWVYPNGQAKTVMILRSAAAIQEDRERERLETQQREEVAQRPQP